MMATTVKMRQRVERRIVQKAIDTLLGAGYVLGVNDGEDTTLGASTDPKYILDQMFSTDQDYLIVRRSLLDRTHCGWLRFIYGNDGFDVLSDYTTNLEEVLKPVNELANAIADGEA